MFKEIVIRHGRVLRYYEFNTLAQANEFANLFHAQNQYSLSTFVNIVVL
jgi:hypothetical protein